MFLPAYRRDTDNFHLERFISWRARLSYELKEFYKRVSDSLLTITRDTFISRPCIFFSIIETRIEMLFGIIKD